MLEIKWQRFGMKWFLILEGWYTLVLIAFEVNILSRFKFTLDSPLAESAMSLHFPSCICDCLCQQLIESITLCPI